MENNIDFYSSSSLHLEMQEITKELMSPKQPEKMSKDPRKQKIKKLKAQIKEAQDNVVTELSSLNLEEEAKLTSEEQETKKNSFKEMLELNKVNIKSLTEELKLTKMNKHSSKFFEWMPTLANRRMRRSARKLRKA